LPALVSETLYLICALAFVLLVGLIALHGRTSRTGVAIVFCCAISAAWAGASAFPSAATARVPTLLDSLRLSAWLLFTAALIFPRASRLGRGSLVAATLVCLAAVGCDTALLRVDPHGFRYSPLQQLFAVALGVAGLLAVENLWRNTVPERRWHVWPICLPVGGVFAFDLFVAADALMLRGEPDSGLVPGQAIVATFTVPLLALAMARNREWRIDIHVSRQIVLHSATLMASGLFLFSVGLVGMVLHRLGGVWGLPLQFAALIGSVFVLGVVLSSHTFWRKLKYFISHHFFSNRYDYRVEWLRFIDRVSNPRQTDELQMRIVSALAEFVDSPAGVLWSLTPGVGYRPTAAWRLPAPEPVRLAADGPFVAAFRDGAWIQVRETDDPQNSWPAARNAAWLAVPLSRGGQIVGFVVLDRPQHKVALDWESFDLLRAAGSQAASYLAEERSTKALLDADLLSGYNKRFAFVVHDIKNLASQLGLVVANARRFIDNPEFQRDMLQTIDDAVARMNRLLGQLNADPAANALPRLDPGAIIDEVAAGFPHGSVVVERRIDPEGAAVAIDREHLRSALTHLVQNAIDASPADEPVVLRAYRLANELVIEIVDRGSGMDPGFVRDALFQPFRSTKPAGYGIGAFQTRELIRMSGGDVDVISEKGRGTTMRVVLPCAAAAAPAAA
jgi:putative PEP-CTERM system histidine kinase